MAKPSDREQSDELSQLLERTRRNHERRLEHSRKMGEEIRADTRRLREAIARFDARSPKK